MEEKEQQNISALQKEDRKFEPSAEFRKNAHVKDESMYELANKDREKGKGGAK